MFSSSVNVCSKHGSVLHKNDLSRFVLICTPWCGHSCPRLKFDFFKFFFQLIPVKVCKFCGSRIWIRREWFRFRTEIFEVRFPQDQLYVLFQLLEFKPTAQSFPLNANLDLLFHFWLIRSNWAVLYKKFAWIIYRWTTLYADMFNAKLRFIRSIFKLYIYIYMLFCTLNSKFSLLKHSCLVLPVWIRRGLPEVNHVWSF